MHGIITAMIIVIVTAVGISLFRLGAKNYVTENCPFILINAKNPDSIEYTVRKAVRTYPECTVYIANKSHSPEMTALLGAISREFSNVHIIEP